MAVAALRSPEEKKKNPEFGDQEAHVGAIR